MLTASQDIDNFIEGQRSKINQPSNRQEANYQRPAPPPPPPPPPPPNDSGDQSNVQVAQVLGETSPRMQTEQPFYSSSSVAPFASSSFMEQQDQQNDDLNKNYYSFFDRFGTHDEVRARLNNDLKREYNEYLQSLQNMAKRKATSQMATSGGNTTRRVQFKQDRIFPSPRQQTDRRALHNTHSMNDISSTSTIHGTQSMNDLSTGSTMHNVQSINDLSSTALTELASNRARARLVQQESEQYIRDREEYILELYQQIYELEGRIRHLEKESHKLTLSNSTSSTRARYTEDLNALNALLAERLNQRVAIDHELAQILNRPPVSLTTRGVVVNTVPSISMPVIVPSTSMPVAASSMSMPIGQMFESSSPRIEQTTMKKRHQNGLETQIREVQTRKVTESQQQYQSPRQQQQNPLIPGRPSTPTHGRGSIYNSIFGTFKTEEQVMRQEKYRQDLLQQIEEKRLRDAAELARRRAAEERERAKEYERRQLLDRQMAEDALRKQEREEEERRQQQLLAEEQERLRRQEELERQRREDELERQRRQDELERQRKQAELDRLKQLDESERKRRQRQEELDRQKRKEEELERQRREELERQRREELERQRREELERQRREELERQRREEEEEWERKRREELERKRREEEEEEERKRREEEEEEERRRRKTTKIGRSNSSLSLGGDGTESDLLRRLLQLKRQLKEKENQFKDTITTDSTRYTHIVDYTLPPYIPPPQPFYLERRESSDDLLNIARIHYRDAPLTHDILLNILHTADGEHLNPSYTRDDSVIMRGIGDGKVFSDAEYLTLPKRVDEADDIFATNLGNAASRRRYGTSLQAFYDDDPLNTADKELNRIASKNDNRLKRLHHIEYADLDHDQLLERFMDKQQLERRGSQTIQLDNTTWLK